MPRGTTQPGDRLRGTQDQKLRSLWRYLRCQLSKAAVHSWLDKHRSSIILVAPCDIPCDGQPGEEHEDGRGI